MIYMTQYDPATKQCTAPSVDSGMATLDDVLRLGGRYLIHYLIGV